MIDDENTSPSKRAAAKARVEELEEELARFRTQTATREEQMPLRERIKELFKKYGFTVTAVLLARWYNNWCCC